MSVTKSNASWMGTLKEGKGVMSLPQGGFEGPFTHASRFAGDSSATNPEELIGAAHAGCFSMFLSALLTKEGYTPTSIDTTASVHLGAGPTITKIELVTEAAVPGLSQTQLEEIAAKAKDNCPVSKALAAVEEITLEVTLVG
jgi:osmotically inducible protein OsmC